MKKIYSLAFGLMVSCALMAQPSYHLVPLVNVGVNPGNLNNDDENPGLPGWSSVLASTTTDAWSAQQSLPFPFQFAGSAVSTFYVSNTGVVTFASSAPSSQPGVTNTVLPSPTVPNNSVCVWGLELSGPNDGIQSKTFGSAPNRQHWIQWTSASAPEMSGQFEWAYWSIVFEESTNNIYIIDQRTFASTGDVALTVGVQASNADFTQVANSPNVGGTTNATSGNGTDVTDNTWYLFAPGAQPQYDLGVVTESVADLLDINNVPFSLTGTVANFGSANVNSFDLNYTINGGAAVTAPVTANVTTPGLYNFTHPTAWSPTNATSYTIEMWATNINGNPDANTANDRISFSVSVYDQAATRQTLMEVFTSSTCPPCRPGNENMDLVVVPTISDYTIVKYQQNYPGAGDPYYTPTARARHDWYGVTGIPNMSIDGQWGGNAASLTAAIFNDFQAEPAFLDFTMNTTEYMLTDVTIDFDINVLLDYPAGNYAVQTAIVEKRTDGNVASNGETEFFNVMMDMLPNEDGMPITGLTNGNTINVTRTVDMSTTNTEEMWDLKVVVWVENRDTKEIMNSAWADITQAIGLEENVIASAQIFPNPAQDFFKVNLKEASDFNVEVVNVAGQVVLANSFTDVDNATLNTKNLTAGVYLVNVISGTEKSTKRLVITK